MFSVGLKIPQLINQSNLANSINDKFIQNRLNGVEIFKFKCNCHRDLEIEIEIEGYK